MLSQTASLLVVADLSQAAQAKLPAVESTARVDSLTAEVAAEVVPEVATAVSLNQIQVLL